MYLYYMSSTYEIFNGFVGFETLPLHVGPLIDHRLLEKLYKIKTWVFTIFRKCVQYSTVRQISDKINTRAFLHRKRITEAFLAI